MRRGSNQHVHNLPVIKCMCKQLKSEPIPEQIFQESMLLFKVFFHVELLTEGQQLRTCMWQSQVEIEHYSIMYFDCITCFRSALAQNFR